MGFLVTTLIFMVVGIIASLCTRICCNRGPATNLFVSSGSSNYYCKHAKIHIPQGKNLMAPFNIGDNRDSLLLDDVGDCLYCANESPYSPNFK